MFDVVVATRHKLPGIFKTVSPFTGTCKRRPPAKRVRKPSKNRPRRNP
jgi:hypothetical protein